MYQDGEYDLAGFAVGSVDEGRLIDGKGVQAGDVVLGLASSGVHSNGFSLVRKILQARRPPCPGPCPGPCCLHATGTVRAHPLPLASAAFVFGVPPQSVLKSQKSRLYRFRVRISGNGFVAPTTPSGGARGRAAGVGDGAVGQGALGRGHLRGGASGAHGHLRPPHPQAIEPNGQRQGAPPPPGPRLHTSTHQTRINMRTQLRGPSA